MSRSLPAGLAAIFGLTVLWQTPLQDQAGREAEQELMRLENELPGMILRGDAAAVERITADDFIGYDPSGREITKADVLARMQATDVNMESLRHEQVRVRVFGDAAVATAVSMVSARYQGKEVGGRFRYTRVWIKRHGRWVYVAAQSTAVGTP